jgi:hypothetical protein
MAGKRLKKLANNASELADYTLSDYVSHHYTDIPMNHKRTTLYFFSPLATKAIGYGT